jgi:hypothetical protein
MLSDNGIFRTNITVSVHATPHQKKILRKGLFAQKYNIDMQNSPFVAPVAGSGTSFFI